MSIRTTTVTVVALACALTACSSSTGTDQEGSKPSKTSSSKELTEEEKEDALAAAGFPKEPVGAARAELLRALAAANPDIVMYEDKAVDAARNQCSAINGGAGNLDFLASQRFSYKDVTTTEAQGKQINAALKRLGFCKV